MQPPEPPKIAAVEVVAAQPTEADRAAIAHNGRDRAEGRLRCEGQAQSQASGHVDGLGALC